MAETGINIREIFGQNVRMYRKKAGLSQELLAEQLEISQNHLGLIERGKQFVSYTLLERMLAVLAVKPAALFYTETATGTDSSANGVRENIVKEELDTAYMHIKKRLHEV